MWGGAGKKCSRDPDSNSLGLRWLGPLSVTVWTPQGERALRPGQGGAEGSPGVAAVLPGVPAQVAGSVPVFKQLQDAAISTSRVSDPAPVPQETDGGSERAPLGYVCSTLRARLLPVTFLHFLSQCFPSLAPVPPLARLLASPLTSFPACHFSWRGETLCPQRACVPLADALCVQTRSISC